MHSADCLLCQTPGGTVLWQNQRLRFTGEASAEAGTEAALANLLNIIGRRDGSRSLLSLG